MPAVDPVAAALGQVAEVHVTWPGAAAANQLSRSPAGTVMCPGFWHRLRLGSLHRILLACR